MEDGSSLPLWGIVILLLLLWLNGIFYGFAAAIKNVSENDILKRAQEGDKKAALLIDLLDKPVQFVNAIPLIVTASGICIGAFLVPWVTYASRRYIKHLPALLLATAFCVILVAALGILTFRRIGTYYPEKFAFRYIKLVHFFVTLLLPLTEFITWIAKITAVPFGVGINQEPDTVTEEEIISIVDEAHEQGVIEENEAEMIQNIISFNETEAHDIMTHRKNVVAFSHDILLKEMVDQMMEEGNSRYPVYGEDLDDIRGIVHYKDAVKFLTQNSWARFQPLKELPGLIRTATLIPETRGIGDLFRTMQAKKLHMAIVVDEYGQTAGIVSMEDILEEIVGDILDEYDEDEDTFRTQKDNSVLIDGMAYLEDVAEELEVDFGESEFETLNGYLTSLLGHIPAKKDLDKEIVANGYRFKILSLGNKTIDKVRAEKINEKELKGEDEKCQDIQNSQT
ncbi:MAG: hemolysin family protein [Eubacteriales bacterium]|nr:hemolysin family protein [Eubacteriales bacterium]